MNQGGPASQLYRRLAVGISGSESRWPCATFFTFRAERAAPWAVDPLGWGSPVRETWRTGLSRSDIPPSDDPVSENIGRLALSQPADELLEKVMFKRLLVPLALVLLAPLSVVAGDTAKIYVEGADYDLISPAIRTADPDKIEVVEFFWYGCGHCYTFEPMITQWKKTLPEDVDFHGKRSGFNPVRSPTQPC